MIPGATSSKTSSSVLPKAFIVTWQRISLITCSRGVGGSFLGSSFGHQTCRMENRVIYFITSRLLSQLKLYMVDGKYIRMMRKLERQEHSDPG